MKYAMNDGTISDRAYPHAFGPDHFARLEDFLLTADRVIPLLDVARGDRSTSAISMRHDVDHNIEHAVKFGKWEALRGIRATYFLLHSAWYWNEPEMMKRGVTKLLEYGHEVGIHNNAVAFALDAGPDPQWQRARDILETAILTLVELGATVRGAAAHGDWRCDKYHVHNNDMWGEILSDTGEASEHEPGGRTIVRHPGLWMLADLGLEYEAYFLHRDAWYISDSGGRMLPDWPLAHDTDHEPPRRTTMLIHPCHWDIDTAMGTT